MQEMKVWTSTTTSKSWPVKFSIRLPNFNEVYTFPNFKIYVVQTKDGAWIHLGCDDYELLKTSGIDPSELTKEELDLCLSLLKA